jgi:hypothetical protein
MIPEETARSGARRASPGPDWLKLLAWCGMIVSLLYFSRLLRADTYQQQQDNHVREIIVRTVHDGDTITADVCFGTLGRTEFWAHNVRLRLKDVRAYEILDDPAKQDVKEREVALIERQALSAALQANDAAPLTARLYRQTYDRYEAVIYTARQNVNELMRTYPQGGR